MGIKEAFTPRLSTGGGDVGGSGVKGTPFSVPRLRPGGALYRRRAQIPDI
eukprot:SAG11_NODE_20833_length_437_cov_0.896450_1_plen_49_part_01